MNINNILITSTFFCLWLTSQIPENAQYSIGLFFIFTLGILHGSNDISIVGKLKKDPDYIKKLNVDLLFEHSHSSENWLTSENHNPFSFYNTPHSVDLYYQINENYKIKE